MPSRLTAKDVQFYKDHGYLLHHKPVLAAPKFKALKDHFEHRLVDFVRSTGKSPEHMDVPHFTDPKLFTWLFDDDVLDLVESLIGPDIALWSSHFICKPPGVGKRVPWHEDSYYWVQALDPMDVVTLWLAIDPSMPENGCMQVIPDTHTGALAQYENTPDSDKGKVVFNKQIKPGQFDESKVVNCTLAPNECSFHHAKVIHGSNANTSPLRRCGYTMRYVPATSKFRREFQDRAPGFQIYLARGKDRAGNHYGDPTKINEAWVNAVPEQRLLVKQLAG
ncbi:MAG: phytanoyl-CoA dioxygenase family protein [Phycisphaeraceae bacterium]|nr:phytanoyl-CoA dioxygenase family protein [Phycisphaeraceae bacterium]